MPEFLTDDQKMIQSMVREFANGRVKPGARERDKTKAFPHDLVKEMAGLGILGMAIPEEWGGAGADTLSYIMAVEELARHCGSTSITLAAHFSLCTYPLFAFGSQEQKKQYLTPLARGEWLGCYGLTEPGSGSDAGSTRTTAVRKGDVYVLNGSKRFITNGSYARIMIATARTDSSQKGSKGVSAFIIDTQSKGYRVLKQEDKLGLRASDTAEIAFEDLEVPVSNLLGEPNTGFARFMKTLEGGRISIGALGLGLGQGALDRAIPYVKERQAFGKPIGSFQAVGFKIANMAMELEAARSLVYRAARAKDAGIEFGHIASMAKLYSSEAGVRAAHEAIQCLGGYGYMEEYEVERFARDVKLCEIGEGTSEIQRMILARHHLGRLS